MTHTPGPWLIKSNSFKSIWVYATTPNQYCTKGELRFYGGYLIAESIPQMSDAHLIAGAPAMLTALKNIENDDAHMPRAIWEEIQSAIAKAEGRLS